MKKFNRALVALMFVGVCGMRAADNSVSLNGKKVILAEDDKMLQRIIPAALGSLGLEFVALAKDGQELIDLFPLVDGQYDGSTECDIIVTDQEMPPGMFGLDAVRQLRKNGVDLPILMYSGKVGTDVLSEQTMEGAGVDAWQNKPAHKDDLTNALHRAFSVRAQKKASGSDEESGS